MAGGATTMSVAVLLVVPAPLWVAVIAPVVFAFAPAVVPVTFTEKLHDPLVPRVPPERLTLPDPAVAAIVPAPQLPVTPFGVATTSPVGSASLNATPLRVLPAF